MRRPWLVLLALALLTNGQAWGQSRSPTAMFSSGTDRYQTALRRSDAEMMKLAVEDFVRAIELNPSYGNAHLELARSLLWLDQADRAASALADARRTGADPLQVALLSAELAGVQGDIRQSREQFRQILGREPYNPDARLGLALLDAASGATQPLIDQLETLRRTYPEQRRLILALAILYAERGNQDAADRYSRIALQYYPNFAQVHLIAADIALSAGRFEQVIRHARNALTINGTLIEAWDYVAQAAVGLGEVDVAAGAVEEQIRLNSSDESAWYRLGVLLFKANEIDRAIHSLRRALSLRQDFELARIALENVALEATPLGSGERAELAARYLDVARDYENRFLNDHARRALRRGLQLDPFNERLRFALALRYGDDGFPARHLRTLEIAAETADPAENRLDLTDLQDRIESYTSFLADSLGSVSEIDQFVAERPRSTVSVVVISRGDSGFLYADEHSARLLVSFLSGEEHLEVDRTVYSAETPVEALLAARRRGDRYLLTWSASHQSDTRTVGTYELKLTRTGATIRSRQLVRSGVRALSQMATMSAEEIAGSIPRFGTVLTRQFETVLFTGGAVDGIEVAQELTAFKNGSLPEVAPDMTTKITESRVVGTVRVSRVDDLIAQGRFTPRGESDRLVAGDIVFLGPYRQEEAQPKDDQQLQQEGNEFNLHLVNRLFSVR